MMDVEGSRAATRMACWRHVGFVLFLFSYNSGSVNVPYHTERTFFYLPALRVNCCVTSIGGVGSENVWGRHTVMRLYLTFDGGMKATSVQRGARTKMSIARSFFAPKL